MRLDHRDRYRLSRRKAANFDGNRCIEQRSRLINYDHRGCHRAVSPLADMALHTPGSAIGQEEKSVL
jgi:hypothetical protein